MATESDTESSVTDREGDSFTADTAMAMLERWYHVPLLAGVIVFMFWTRFQNYSVFQRDGEGVWLLAVDSWYHWRTTTWTVENFPWLIGWDPWTGFPDGRLPGQFGTLFDFIVATLAMGIGLGSPTEQDILLAALIAVPAMAALVAIPVYYMGKRLGNRPGALAGVAFLALTSGTFFARGLAGQFQHHAAEVLFMSVAVLSMMVALSVGEDEKPIWELVAERNWEAVRRPAIYSALAGVALTLYIWTWPPGIVLIGIFGVFFVLQLSLDYVRGRSPDHLAFVGAVSMAVVVIGTAVRIQEPGFGATGLDYLPPVFAFVVGAGCVFMAALARQWDVRGLDRRQYPAAVGASLVGSLVVLAVVLPEFVSTLVGSLSGRIFPFGHSPGALTVAEVQPPASIRQEMLDQYGMAFFLGLVAIPVLVFRATISENDRRAESLLVVVWALFLFSMAITQTRFNYYFVVAVAVLNASLVGFIFDWIEIPDGETVLANVQPYQVLALALVVMLLFMPLLPPVATSTPVSDGSETFPTGDGQNWLDAVKWEQGNDWLAENTPEVGNYGGAGNGGQLDYYGSYDRPSDGSFEYPRGAYGVLAWWDYGHLITVQGERIPHANPFQQNVESTSAFLTAQNETQAELYLDAIAAGESPNHESDMDDVREAASEADDDGGIQYVMIDDDIAGGKFFPITEWTGPQYQEYIDRETVNGQEVIRGGDFYDTMLSRLYLDDATGLEHYRLVHEIPVYSYVGFTLEGRQIAGPYDLGQWTEDDEAFNTQLASAREAGQIVENLGMSEAHVASALKTFERVEGATLTGDTEPGAVVVATVTMETETDRTFEYEQTAQADENGAFELTVPYPTDETLGPEDGYADSSVLMSTDTDGYEITVLDSEGDVIGTADGVAVPEDDVQEGATIDVTFD